MANGARQRAGVPSDRCFCPVGIVAATAALEHEFEGAVACTGAPIAHGWGKDASEL